MQEEEQAKNTSSLKGKYLTVVTWQPHMDKEDEDEDDNTRLQMEFKLFSRQAQNLILKSK